MLAITASLAQTSADFSDGSVIFGSDNRSCDSSLEGNIKYNPGIPASGLIHYWPLDETTGSSITDVVGGLVTTWDDGANNDVAEETVAGVVGTALAFDGNVEIDAANYSVPSVGTIAMWIKFASDGTRYRFFGFDDMYELVKNTSDEVESDIFDSGGANSSGTVSAGVWYHIAFTYDEPGDESNVYINGVLDDTGGASGNLVGGPATLGIGHRFGYSGNELDGELDEVRIYNRVLSPPEIAAIHSPSDSKMQYCNGTAWTDF